MSVFDKFKTVDYASKVKSFNPDEPTAEHLALIEMYKTPSRSYIKPSARNLNYIDVGLDTLQYIITTCHQCSFEEKYQAIIVTILKLFKESSDLVIVEEAKAELIPYLNGEPIKKLVDLSFIDELIKGYSHNFFYIIKISIGANSILKFGKTNQSPRLRLTQIKSDINANYKQSVTVEPVVLVHCEDVSKLEEEVKVLMSENNILQTGYNFKGATETFSSKDIKSVIGSIVPCVVKKHKAAFIYSIED